MAYGDFKDLPRLALIKYYVVKHLILLKKTKYDGYQGGLASVLNFLIKSPLVVVLKVKLCQTNNYQKNYTNQLLENLKKINKSVLIF